MADEQMIGEILSQRRRQLGLSVDRVVDGTKLQRRIIEAFENSDFDQMPPKGYAKATLGSYARFLGLDANEVIRIYEDQLYYHERQMAASARGHRPSSDQGRSGSSRRMRPGTAEVPASRAFGSGRRLSNNLSRAYPDTPASDRPGSRRRESRPGYGRAGDGRYGDSGRTGSRRGWEEPYEAQTSRGLYDFDSPGGLSSRRSSRDRYGDDAWDAYPASRQGAPRRGRPDWQDGPAAGDDLRRPSSAPRTREFDDPRGPQRAARRGGPRPTQVVSLDDGYQGGSGGEMRPPVEGRTHRSASDRVRESLSMTGSLDGVRGVLRGISSFFSQNRMAALITFSALALLLVVAIVMGISSCSRSRTASQGNTIPVVSVGDSSDQGTALSTDAAQDPAQQADGADAQAAGGDASVAQPEATDAQASDATAVPALDLAALPYGSVLSFAVAADAATPPWIEVTVDGTAVYAANAAPGEFQSFTVNSSAVMTLSNPELVTITVNDTVVQPTVDELGTATVNLAVAADAQAADAAQGDIDQGEDLGGQAEDVYQ